jgi:cytochrome c biogenesis protein CcdA
LARAAASSALVDRMRRVLPYVNRISGAILVAVGLYVAYYGWFEVRLFGADAAGAASAVDDPVITGAGRVQRALAGWVYAHGAWPWIIGLGAVTVITAAVAWTRRRNKRRVHSRSE